MRALVVGLVLVVALSACVDPASPPRASATGARTATPIAPLAGTATPTAAATSAGVRPAFLSFVFTDVRDGTQFKLTDFPGKSVLVIGMAVW
jgi:hypothetical protein